MAEQLKSRVETLCDAIENEADGNLPGRDDLYKIREVLMEIKGKLTRDDGNKDTHLLPPSKREELDILLPTIERALEQRKQKPPPPEAEQHPAADKKLLPSAAGCYPCKPRPSQQQRSRQQQQEEDDAAVSLKLLLRLTKNVLEPEQYYEWTTSYVDESRIYGWDKEADEVADALVGGVDDGLLFRAAGIAGIHGSGKTALAQKVFVHDKAKDNFALRLWVCVGPPDSEDRFGLLYRMLDNLGLDTAKVEDIVHNSNVVRQATHKEEERLIKEESAAVEEIRKNAADRVVVAAAKDAKNKEEEEEGSVAGAQQDAKNKEEELLKEKAHNSPAVQKSKIGVLLYILHMTLSKTSYLIVFDDIRAYGDDGWYSNLALLPPPEGEWGDRLGYGLPKGTQHRGAVLVTCRSEDDARSMVRNKGRVVRPPRLQLDDAWKLFEREYRQAREAKRSDKDGGGKGGDDGMLLLKELGEMREQIVNKCLGLPVAIAEAAKGFAALDPLPDDNATPAAADQATQQPSRAEINRTSKVADD